jgi:hypothetical protein
MLDDTSPCCNNWDHFCRSSEMHWNFLLDVRLHHVAGMVDVGVITEFSHIGMGLGRES